jgi:hypothetical protein
MEASDGKPPLLLRGGGPNDLSLADRILHYTQYLYALVLLVAFITCAAWYSVYNAKKDHDVAQSQVKGPGGKPLPVTKSQKREDGERKIGPRFNKTAKIIFRCIAAGVFLSYIASGLSIFIHAFWHEDSYKWSREGLPWAGEWTVVSTLAVTLAGHCSPLWDFWGRRTAYLTMVTTGPRYRISVLLPLHLVVLVRLAQRPEHRASDRLGSRLCGGTHHIRQHLHCGRRLPLYAISADKRPTG